MTVYDYTMDTIFLGIGMGIIVVGIILYFIHKK